MIRLFQYFNCVALSFFLVCCHYANTMTVIRGDLCFKENIIYSTVLTILTMMYVKFVFKVVVSKIETVDTEEN